MVEQPQKHLVPCLHLEKSKYYTSFLLGGSSSYLKNFYFGICSNESERKMENVNII